MKRQRATTACQKCRSLKAKCDGQRPTCARCIGYGFSCTWAVRKRGHSSGDSGNGLDPRSDENSPHVSTSVPSDNHGDVHRLAAEYAALVQTFRSKLNGPERTALDTTLNRIQQQCTRLSHNDDVPTRQSARSNVSALRHNRYLGKASDIRFFNMVKDFMQEGMTPKQSDDHDSEGYDQSNISETTPTYRRPIYPPERTAAVSHLEIYFSTIHAAYPFLCEPMVVRHFERMMDGNSDEVVDSPWLVLLNYIFAIGSYYSSFPHSEGSTSESYLVYAEEAAYYSSQIMGSCTLTAVWALLVQCFFLLATCQTDRCWNTLGLAIRMGQCIGLHVNVQKTTFASNAEIPEQELRRRTWYSMYVLDQLLALQLGRPYAIHKEDFDVTIPSRAELPDFEIGGEQDEPQELACSREEGGDGDFNPERAQRDHDVSNMDYFLNVILFSDILGQVIRSLYHPTQRESSPDEILLSISSLDQSLQHWKLSLPRHLRFDLGHTFEKSTTFRRQRNMLAVKYHHLRALIHRPFFCLPWLRRNDLAYMDILRRNRAQIDRAERICVFEAQQTARLLHSVEDERSLVHDFPWWQMISCLICASSILLVADSLLSGRQNDTDMCSQDFMQDAQTCLKVFEALSVNSDAARKATDMLKALADVRLPSEKELPYGPSSSVAMDLENSTSSALPAMPSTTNDAPVGAAFVGALDEIEWPSEMSETMAWSAQFFYPGYNAMDGQCI